MVVLTSFEPQMYACVCVCAFVWDQFQSVQCLNNILFFALLPLFCPSLFGKQHWTQMCVCVCACGWACACACVLSVPRRLIEHENVQLRTVTGRPLCGIPLVLCVCCLREKKKQNKQQRVCVCASNKRCDGWRYIIGRESKKRRKCGW